MNKTESLNQAIERRVWAFRDLARAKKATKVAKQAEDVAWEAYLEASEVETAAYRDYADEVGAREANKGSA